MSDKPELNEDMTNDGGDNGSTTDKAAENEFYFEDKSFEKEMEPHEVEDFVAYELGSEEDPVEEEKKNSHSLIHTLTKTLTELRLPRDKKKKKKHERHVKSAVNELDDGEVTSHIHEAPAPVHMYTSDDAEVTEEAPEQETVANEAPEQETVANEAPEQETPANEAPEQETIANEAPEQETAASEVSTADTETAAAESTVTYTPAADETDDVISEGKVDELPEEMLNEVYRLIPDSAAFDEAAHDMSEDKEFDEFVRNEDAEPVAEKAEEPEKKNKKKSGKDKRSVETSVPAQAGTAAAAITAAASDAVQTKKPPKPEKVKKVKTDKSQNKKADTAKNGKKNEINIARIIIVPVVISIIVAFLLSFVNQKTAEIISENNNKAMTASIEKIFEREVDCKLYSEDADQKVYIVYNGTNLYGACIDLTTIGYGGEMEMLIGLDADNTILKIEFVTMSETPGLGAKVKQPDFKDQFKGKNSPVILGTDVDAITGATISSTAVTNAVNKVLSSGMNLYNVADELGMTVLLPSQWDGAQENPVSEETTAVPETTAETKAEMTPQTEQAADETAIGNDKVTGGNTNVNTPTNKTNVTKNPAVTQAVVCQHTMSAAVDVAATCTAPARTVRTCTKCGYEESTPAGTETAPHTPANPVIEGADSVVRCSVCGAEISRTPVPAEPVTEAPAPDTTAPVTTAETV